MVALPLGIETVGRFLVPHRMRARVGGTQLQRMSMEPELDPIGFIYI